MPQISVILPFYNAEKTLVRSLASIRSQTFRDFECIMVDNHSTDRGWQTAREQADQDRRFLLFSESRQGVVHAFQRGVEMAKGALIARMDADDSMHPERLMRQKAFLEDHPEYDAVGGLVKYCGDGTGDGGFARYVEWNNTVISYEQILKQRFIDSPIVNPSAMWRREVGVRLGHYREGDFPEDYEMWLRWLDEGVKMAKLPCTVLDWHDAPDRLTRNHPAYSDEAFYRVKSRYLARWLKRNNRHHPEVAIWGASRISRQRAALLEPYEIRIACYIDIRRQRQLDKPLLYYKDLPDPGDCFILVYVRQWDAKERIARFLDEKGYVEGHDYLMVS